MSTAFVIHSRDNVATALDNCPAGQPVVLIGNGPSNSVIPGEDIRTEHKVAIAPILENELIIKYGMPIGRAYRAIAPGEWVHLHNCGSNYDKRSNSLDGDTGAPTDTEYV